MADFFERPCTPEITVTVGGLECQLIDYTTQPTFNSQYAQDNGGGGPWQMTWSMPNLDPNFNHPAFTDEAPVTARVGSQVIWSGQLLGYERDAPWYFTALGYAQYTKDYNALNLAGNASSTPDDVIKRAISLGYNVRLPLGGFNPNPYIDGDTTAALNILPALLDADATASGVPWVVDAERFIRKLPKPTTPKYHVFPAKSIVSVLDADFYTTLNGRYIAGLSSDTTVTDFDFDDQTYKYQTATVTDAMSLAMNGGKVKEAPPIDLRALGPMAPLGAGALARGNAEVNLQARLVGVVARVSFSNSIVAQWNEVLSPGGVPVPLCFLQAGEMFRIHGITDNSGNIRFGAYADIVMGNVSYTGGEKTIELDPIGLKARDMASFLADAVKPAPAQTGTTQNPATGWFVTT